jgi:hypothetical protein
MAAAVQMVDDRLQQSIQLANRMRQVLATQPQQAAVTEAQGLTEAAAPQAPMGANRAARSTVQGKTDGWGIPRTFQSDLGARGVAVVRPAGPAAGLNAAAETSVDEAVMPPAKYSGRAIVRGATAVRDLDTLHGLPWKQLDRAERAIAVNLGWDVQTWDAKDSPNARVPMSYRTPFSELEPHVQESVRLLGLQNDWDRRVAAFQRGG